MARLTKQQKQNVRQWITALTDGSYKKGRNALCRWSGVDEDFRWCCLGVLEDLHVKGTWRLGPGGDYSLGFDTHMPGRDKRLWEKVGLTQDDFGRLAHLNDGKPTWDEVVKYIRRHTGI